MITEFHHEQKTEFDKEVIKIADAYKNARPKNKKFHSDELAAARSAADKAAEKSKNLFIRHGGDYTSIHLKNPSKEFASNARVAIITCKPGPYPVEEKTGRAKK